MWRFFLAKAMPVVQLIGRFFLAKASDSET
jgi:hypothetical protein